MYARGMSVRGDIVGHLRDLYGVEDSPDAVADAVLDKVAAWQARPLEPVYPIVFFDALRQICDEGLVRNKAFDIAWCSRRRNQRDSRSLARTKRRRQILATRHERAEKPWRQEHPSLATQPWLRLLIVVPGLEPKRKRMDHAGT
jgi:hypothetical protein